MPTKTLRVNFSYMKAIHIIHLHYHPKIRGYLLKNKQKTKRVLTHEITRLIIMKMKMKTKNSSHRYDIKGPTITHKIFQANCSFHVKQRTTGKI